MNRFEILKREIAECRIRAKSDETRQVLEYLQEFAEGHLNNGWSEVNDELLKEYSNKEILIYTACGNIKKAIYSVDNSPYIDDDGKEYQYSHWFSDEFGDFICEFDEIKYWQPLPQQPKEEPMLNPTQNK